MADKSRDDSSLPLGDTGPAGRKAVVSRPRLERRLAEVCAARVTLLRAPAGYGKSCLVQQWLQNLRARGVTAAHLALPPDLSDPLDFLTQLVGAIHAQTTLRLPTIHSFLAGEMLYSADVLAGRIVERLREAEQDVFLLLDDVHHLTGSPASACLRLLIDAAPPRLRIVLASREKLDIPLARLRAHGQMCEISAEDLRFLDPEIAELLAASGVENLSADEFAILAQRSEGWAVGLRLAALALAENPNRAAILRDFSGDRSDIWDYFVQDVVAGQDDEVQDFLLKTSVLDRLCAPLCDAVTGRTDSQTLLDHCAQTGLFVFALDANRSWYRFHHLFQDFLARGFQERFSAERAALHARASAWYLEAGLYEEAFEQALRGNDPIRAAEILDTRLDAMFSAGQARTIRRLAAEIPAHIQAFYPRIMLAAAWPMSVQWRFSEVRDLLTACRARLSDMRRLNATPPDELDAIENLMRHREMILAQVQDDMPTVEAIGAKLMHSYPDAHPFVAGSICSAYLQSKREHYKFSETGRLDAAARSFLQKCESEQVLIAHDAVAGMTRFTMGDTETAIAQLRNGLDIAVRLFGRGASIGATCALPLAELHFECNDTAEASALLDEFLPAATELGFVDQLISGWLTQSRLLRMNGERDAALRVLSTASAFAAEHGFERLGLFAADERVRQLLRSGRPDEAARAARQAGLKPSGSAPMPSGKACVRDEARASMWVSWLEIQNRTADALNVARQWRSFTAGAGALRQAIRWDVRTAHLLRLTGEIRGAKRILLRAMEMAAPSGFVRSFLDEPGLLDAVLPLAPAGRSTEPTALDALAAHLHTERDRESGRNTVARATPEPEPPGLGGRLTTQELQVLKLAASGLTNREAGDRLGITEGSIKWHLQQIYDKIGVRRRLQAVERARHLGLIG